MAGLYRIRTHDSLILLMSGCLSAGTIASPEIWLPAAPKHCWLAICARRYAHWRRSCSAVIRVRLSVLTWHAYRERLRKRRGGGDRRCFKTLAIIHNNLLVSDLWYAQTTSPTVSSDNASTVLFRQIIVTTYLSCVISEIVNIFMALAKWLRITSSITDCRSQVVG